MNQDANVSNFFSNYRDEGTIGQGGMSEIHHLIDHATGQQYAAKLLHAQFGSDPETRQRFYQEAEACRRLSHPHIISVHAFGTFNDRLCLVMDFMDRGSLKDLMDEVKEISPPIACYIVSRLLAALTHAHNSGIIHRDVKPSNLLLSSAGEIKLTDFGISRVEDMTRLTKSGSLLGTPAYMAPEQAKGERADERSDLFSVGVLFYEMLTGINPFAAETPGQTLMNILVREPAPLFEKNPEIPVSLEAIVDRLTTKRPSDRYQTAADARRELEDAASHIEPVCDTESWRSYIRAPRAAERRIRLDISGALFQRAQAAYQTGGANASQIALAAYRSHRLDPENVRVREFMTSISQREGISFEASTSTKIRRLEMELDSQPQNVALLLQLVKLSRAEGNIIKAISYAKRLEKLKRDDVYIMSQIQPLLSADDLTVVKQPSPSAPTVPLPSAKRPPRDPAKISVPVLPPVKSAIRSRSPFSRLIVPVVLVAGLGLFIWILRSTMDDVLQDLPALPAAAPAATAPARAAAPAPAGSEEGGPAAKYGEWQRALELERDGKLVTAVELLNKLYVSLNDGPGAAEVALKLGRLYQRMGDGFRAEEQFNLVTSRFDQSLPALDAFLAKSDLSRDKGDLTQAAFELESAEALFSLLKDAERRAGILLAHAALVVQLNDLDKAIRLLEQAIDQQPDRETLARAHLELGDVLLKRGSELAAKDHFIQAKQLAPATSYVSRVADERLEQSASGPEAVPEQRHLDNADQ